MQARVIAMKGARAPDPLDMIADNSSPADVLHYVVTTLEHDSPQSWEHIQQSFLRRGLRIGIQSDGRIGVPSVDDLLGMNEGVMRQYEGRSDLELADTPQYGSWVLYLAGSLRALTLMGGPYISSDWQARETYRALGRTWNRLQALL